MHETECPACGDIIKLGSRPKMGQRIECRNCHTSLKVTWLSPLDLDWFEEGYDEDEDEDEGGFSGYRRPGNRDKKRA